MGAKSGISKSAFWSYSKVLIFYIFNLTFIFRKWFVRCRRGIVGRMLIHFAGAEGTCRRQQQLRGKTMNCIKLGLLAATAMLTTPVFAAAPADILATYSNIAEAEYADALATAKTLREAVDKLVAEPTEVNPEAARTAWRQARNPYQQTEA